MAEQEESIEVDDIETSRIFGPNITMSINKKR